MPAVNTSGFNVGVMPSVNFADPRLLAPQYSQILPGISQGLQVAEQFQGAPTRRQLAQIQLQQAQEQLAQAPIRQQLAQIQLAEAQKRAAIPEIIPGDVTMEDVVAPEDYPALDEAGVRTAPMPLGDLVKVQQGQRVGAGGVLEPFTQRTTLKTAAEREAQAEKEAVQLEATRALATSRVRGKDFEYSDTVQKYQDALDTGDAEAAAFYKSRIDKLNAPPGILAPGTAYTRRMEQLAADAGITLERATELSKTPEGAQALAQAAVANKAIARDPMKAMMIKGPTEAQKAMLYGETAAPSATEFSSRVGSMLGAPKAPQSFNSADDVRSAYRAGRISREDAEAVLKSQFGLK